ncbi:MAG TPA: ABC transporter permease [Gaiellaceae bacterium]|nr:ABC transporter permease [Gaiellaceae bacterium]
MSVGFDKTDMATDVAVPTDVAVQTADDQAVVKARGYWELVWIRFRRDRLAIAGGIFIVFLFAAAYGGAPLAQHLLHHGPNDIFPFGVNQATLTPVGPWTHISLAPYPGASGHFGHTLLILGGDSQLGRDLFLRLLYGAQTSLEVAIFATAGSVALGVFMGLLAGYFRGWVDTVISRLVEMVMVFPFLLFIIALRIVAGPTLNSITLGFLPHGVVTLALIFTIFGWFYPARIIRGVVLSLREKEFIEAARMTGASDFRIMRSHLLPHLVAPIIVYSSLIVAQNIIAEAGLSFLGLGIDQPTASWGNLLATAPDFYLTQPWLMVWPGLCILLTTLAFNLLGDGLRDAFDPRARI